MKSGFFMVMRQAVLVAIAMPTTWVKWLCSNITQALGILCKNKVLMAHTKGHICYRHVLGQRVQPYSTLHTMLFNCLKRQGQGRVAGNTMQVLGKWQPARDTAAHMKRQRTEKWKILFAWPLSLWSTVASIWPTDTKNWLYLERFYLLSASSSAVQLNPLIWGGKVKHSNPGERGGDCLVQTGWIK